VYVAPGTNGAPYDLYTLGADGQVGGEGVDADINAREIK
jgi:general secretion pathway protein G